MSDFIPILNFNFGETPVLKAQEELEFYVQALDALSKSFNEIEISFVSDAFVFNAKEILQKAQQLNLRLSFGSIYEAEQVTELIKLLKDADFHQAEIKIFAPVYKEDIKNALKENQDFVFQYIPGFYTKSELLRYQDYLQDADYIKIFPFSVDSARSLYHKMTKPYPELANYIYQSRILFASKELIEKYSLLDNLKKDENGFEYLEGMSCDKAYLIKSPYHYQRIRSQFLFNTNIKIFFDFENKFSKNDVFELTKKHKVFLTGIDPNCIDDDLIANDSIILAKSVFANTLKDYLSGAVATEDLAVSFEDELYPEIKQK